MVVMLNFILPAFCSSSQQEMRVAPVVQTSSTISRCFAGKIGDGVFAVCVVIGI